MTPILEMAAIFLFFFLFLPRMSHIDLVWYLDTSVTFITHVYLAFYIKLD